MQFTDLLIVHFFSFLFFALKLACFIDYENPPNKCAKMTRQKKKKCAKMTSQINAPK